MAEQKFPKFIYESEEQKIGSYTDIIRIGFSAYTFGIDFAQLLPPESGEEGIVRVLTRVVMSPAHAKSLLNYLRDRIKLYEDIHGKIELPEKKEEEKK
jgi:hypothetical protein